MKNTYMNSLKQNPQKPPENVNCEHKVKWIDEDRKEPLVTVINPPRTKASKRPKYTPFEHPGAKKLGQELSKKSDNEKIYTVAEYLNEMENVDYTPLKVDNFIKPKAQIRTINFNDEANKKKINTRGNVVIRNANTKTKDLKVVSYKKLKKETDVILKLNLEA